MIYTLYTHNTSIVLMFINQFRAPTANKIKSNTGTTIQIDNITCYLAYREILVPFYFCPSCPHHQRTRQFLNIFVNIYQIYFILRQMSKLKTRQKSMNGVKWQKNTHKAKFNPVDSIVKKEQMVWIELKWGWCTYMLLLLLAIFIKIWIYMNYW